MLDILVGHTRRKVMSVSYVQEQLSWNDFLKSITFDTPVGDGVDKSGIDFEMQTPYFTVQVNISTSPNRYILATFRAVTNREAVIDATIGRHSKNPDDIVVYLHTFTMCESTDNLIVPATELLVQLRKAVESVVRLHNKH
jgi:hypothetical protein